jgi:hypothetical protein
MGTNSNTIGNLLNEHDLGLFSKKSLAKIEAVTLEARAELLEELSRGIELVVVDMATLDGHHAREFFPSFERYIERLYDVYAEELLPVLSVPQDMHQFLMNVTDRISKQILPEPESVGSAGPVEGLSERLKDPERRQEPLDLSVSSGDWEINLECCLERRLYALVSQTSGGHEAYRKLLNITEIFLLK